MEPAVCRRYTGVRTEPRRQSYECRFVFRTLDRRTRKHFTIELLLSRLCKCSILQHLIERLHHDDVLSTCHDVILGRRVY